MDYLLEAFRQSFYAVGNSDPNPPVGAVIVSSYDKIIGKGYTQVPGKSHAEVMAINDVLHRYGSEILKTSTLYVTLEPCSHFGKTPPCTDLILKYNIPKVVFASYDRNVKVRGASLLIEKGVAVHHETDPRYKDFLFWTIDSFHEFLNQKKPRVWLKWAQTYDGFLAPEKGPSGPVSGNDFREIVFRLRKCFQGIMATPGTIYHDLPMLTPRYGGISLSGLLPEGAFNDLLMSFEDDYPESSRSLQNRIFLLPDIQPEDQSRFRKFLNVQAGTPGNSHFLAMPGSKTINIFPEFKIAEFDFTQFDKILEYAGNLGCLNLLVEAGPEYAQKFSDSGVADFLIISRSRKRKWDIGRSFHLSKEMSEKNNPGILNNIYQQNNYFPLKEDDMFIYSKK